MENSNHKKKFSRRNFLESGITGASGVALGLVAGHLLFPADEKDPQFVKMLTADGKLVEVDKRFLPPMCGNPVPVSNKELLDWMEKGKG